MDRDITSKHFKYALYLAAICLAASAGNCAAVRYDRDGDGVEDSIDIDPFKAEDRDGFEDDDGLPELPSPVPAEKPSETSVEPAPERPAPETARSPETAAIASGLLSEPSGPDTLELDGTCFKAGEFDLASERLADLKSIAGRMAEEIHSLLVVRTFVDTSPAFLINQSLAEIRARSIRDYLTETHGISDSRITIEPVKEIPIQAARRDGYGAPVDCRVQIILIHEPD